MKCDHCGQELIFIRQTKGDEYVNFNYANSKLVSVKDAMDPKIIRDMKLTDEQILPYFQAVFQQRAEAEFLLYIARKELARSLKEETGKDYSPESIYINDSGVYVHP